MKTDSLSRFRKRRKMKSAITVYDDIDQNIVDELLTSEVNQEKVDNVYKSIKEHYDMSVSEDEAQVFLVQFKKDFNDERFNKLVLDCKKDVINSIVTPFGLGKVVAAYDKAGGNVDTIHNVRNKDFVDSDGTTYTDGIYATDKAQNDYENKDEYNSDEYHKDSKYIKINKQYSAEKKASGTTDYITGEKITQHDKHDLDHVVSAKEIHDDSGRVLAEINGADLANTDINLKPTDSGINRSKKADTMQDFLVKKNERIKEMEVLKNRQNLSPQEEKKLQKLEKLNQIDDEKAMQADKEARTEQTNKMNKAYYSSGKFAKDTLSTGAIEGAKMGMQQALGLIITEFFTAVFDEILDIYKNGFSHGFDNDSFFIVLKERLQTIGTRVKDKWKDAAMAFQDGFISGFISNLATTVINMFVTTGKRVVRIIREGLFSLFRAIKLLVFPPEGMTYEDAMHEAKKLIATGLIVSLGVIAEEWIDTLIKGTVVLEPFADILTGVFVGAITGLSITMVVYYIDKKRNDKEMFNSLVNDAEQQFDKLDKLLSNLNYGNTSVALVNA